MTTDSTKATRLLPGFAADATPGEIVEGRAIGAANRAALETLELRERLLAELARCGFVATTIGGAALDRISLELPPEEAERLIGLLARAAQ